jgi:hypothetical protein
MIYGPYEITQAEWDNWPETMKQWQEWYDDYSDIMQKGGWGAYEIPTHLRLYHVLVHISPEGFVTRPTQMPGSLKLCAYVLTGDTFIVPVSTFRVTGGKQKTSGGCPCCINTRTMRT